MTLLKILAATGFIAVVAGGQQGPQDFVAARPEAAASVETISVGGENFLNRIRALRSEIAASRTRAAHTARNPAARPEN